MSPWASLSPDVTPQFHSDCITASASLGNPLGDSPDITHIKGVAALVPLGIVLDDPPDITHIKDVAALVPPGNLLGDAVI